MIADAADIDRAEAERFSGRDGVLCRQCGIDDAGEEDVRIIDRLDHCITFPTKAGGATEIGKPDQEEGAVGHVLLIVAEFGKHCLARRGFDRDHAPSLQIRRRRRRLCRRDEQFKRAVGQRFGEVFAHRMMGEQGFENRAPLTDAGC